MVWYENYQNQLNPEKCITNILFFSLLFYFLGLFWQADHILPVSEGGGECTMENIRTLCTACHQKETTLLRRRLRDVKLGESAKGTSDIRGFFGSNSSIQKKKQQKKKDMGQVVDLTL